MNIQQQKYLNILLVGDSCLDIFHYGECNRVSPEAPVLIMKKELSKTKSGMAANVRDNLESFFNKVYFHTNTEEIIKNRYIDTRYNQHLLRVDEGEAKPLESFNVDNIQDFKYDALIISDYNKGFITPNIAKKLCKKFKNIPIFVDSKKNDLSCFSNCFLKINKKEFEESIRFGRNTEVIVTLGPNGARYNDKIYEVNKVDVFDVSGAGDVFLSSLASYFLRTKDIDKAIRASNLCASYSITKLGTYVLTEEDLKKIGVYNDLYF